MFRRILVPLDGSARAERAVAVAARLARAASGAVILVRVADSLLRYGLSRSEGTAPAAPAREADAVAAYLQSLAGRDDLRGVEVETEALEGHVAEGILAAAAGHRADLVTLTRHGRTGPVRWALGGVAQKVARHAPMPVLMLHDAGVPLPGAETAGPGPVTVLVPLDGSPLAEAALLPAAALVAALAAPGKGRLGLLRVVDVPRPRTDRGEVVDEEEIGGVVRPSVHAEAEAYLETTARGLRGLLSPGRQPAITTAVAYDVDAAGGILDAAAGRRDAQGVGLGGPADVIAIATHGRGGLDRWAVGSVTDRVIEAAARPLLVVRPAGDAAGRGEAEAGSLFWPTTPA